VRAKRPTIFCITSARVRVSNPRPCRSRIAPCESCRRPSAPIPRPRPVRLRPETDPPRLSTSVTSVRVFRPSFRDTRTDLDRPTDRCPCRLHKSSFRDTRTDRVLPLVVHQKCGGEELGCSRWSFTRTRLSTSVTSVTQVEFPGHTHRPTDPTDRPDRVSGTHAPTDRCRLHKLSFRD